MKKTYQHPLTMMVSVETQKFIAASDMTGMQTEDSFSVSFSSESTDGEGASRRGGWFDED